MELVVYKYPMPQNIGELVYTDIPVPAKPLMFDRDMHGMPCVWIEHPAGDDVPKQSVGFRVVATGQPFDQTQTPRHVQSMNDRGFIWHLYTSLAW